MDTRKSKELLKREELVERLSRSKVTNVTTGTGVIRFRYDGFLQTFNVKTNRHVPWVGHWNKRTLTLDDDVRNKKDILCMAIHEGIEAHVARRYKLDRDYTAHYIATRVEQAFAKGIRHNWDDYQMRTELIYRRIQNGTR
jgi:hypothetical protein